MEYEWSVIGLLGLVRQTSAFSTLDGSLCPLHYLRTHAALCVDLRDDATAQTEWCALRTAAPCETHGGNGSTRSLCVRAQGGNTRGTGLTSSRRRRWGAGEAASWARL